MLTFLLSAFIWGSKFLSSFLRKENWEVNILTTQISENVFILSSYLIDSLAGCKILSCSSWIWKHSIIPLSSSFHCFCWELWVHFGSCFFVCTFPTLSHSKSLWNFLIVFISLKFNDDEPWCVRCFVGSFQPENLCLPLLETLNISLMIFLSSLSLFSLSEIPGCSSNLVSFSTYFLCLYCFALLPKKISYLIFKPIFWCILISVPMISIFESSFWLS